MDPQYGHCRSSLQQASIRLVGSLIREKSRLYYVAAFGDLLYTESDTKEHSRMEELHGVLRVQVRQQSHKGNRQFSSRESSPLVR